MEYRDQFIDGVELAMQHPWGDLPPCVALGVLTSKKTEIEVLRGDTKARDFFLQVTGCKLGQKPVSSSIGEIEVGRTSQGNEIGFSILANGAYFFGRLPGLMGPTDLPGLVTFQGKGISTQHWSPNRSRSVLQVVPEVGLFDVRQKLKGGGFATDGIPVRSGRLARGSVVRGEVASRWLVLETSSVVCYVLPNETADIDRVADQLANDVALN